MLALARESNQKDLSFHGKRENDYAKLVVDWPFEDFEMTCLYDKIMPRFDLISRFFLAYFWRRK